MKNTRRYPNGPLRRPSRPVMPKKTSVEQLRAIIAKQPPGVVVIEVNNTVPVVPVEKKR